MINLSGRIVNFVPCSRLADAGLHSFLVFDTRCQPCRQYKVKKFEAR